MAADYFRAFERRACSLPARLYAFGGTPEAARLLNLCLGGACVDSPMRPEIGMAVRLEVAAPNLWKPLVLPARVAWVRASDRASRMGLSFQIDDARVTGWLLEVLGSSAYT